MENENNKQLNNTEEIIEAEKMEVVNEVQGSQETSLNAQPEQVEENKVELFELPEKPEEDGQGAVTEDSDEPEDTRTQKEKDRDELNGQINDYYELRVEEKSEDEEEDEEPLSEEEANAREKKLWKFRRKVKRGLKALRARKLKNFLMWLTGVFSGLIMLFSAIFIVVGVVPVKNFFGDVAEESVSEDVGNKSILGLIMNIDEYTKTFGTVKEAFPIVEKTVKDLLAGLDDYVDIDLDVINDVPFSDSEFSAKLFKGVKIVATLETLGATDLLGDFAKLPIFENSMAINTETGVQYTTATIDTEKTEFNYKLYTYYNAETEKYISASNDAGDGWAEAIVGETAVPLYYADLSVMPFSDLASVIGERIGVIKTADLIDTFAEGASDGVIGDILGDMQVSEMGTFNADNIKISAFIDRFVIDEETKQPTTTETDTYRLMRKLYNVPDDEEIMVSHFSGEMNFDNVEVSEFIDRYVVDENTKLPTDTETDTYRLLRKIYAVPDDQAILVSHLGSEVDFSGVEVAEFVTRYETDGVTETSSYKLLRDITGIADGDITVKHLTDALDGGIKLSAFVTRYEDDGVTETKLYKLVRSAFNVPSDRDITTDDLGGTFDVNSISLDAVLERYEADGTTETATFKQIRKMTGIDSGDMSVGDLTDALTNGIKLSAYLTRYEEDRTTETKLYKIIRSAFNVPSDRDITTDDLGGTFDVNKIVLEDVLDRYEDDGETETQLFKVLADVTTGTGMGGKILVGDLGDFNTDNIRLSTVLDSSSGLYDIIRDAVPATGPNGEIIIGDLMNFSTDDIVLSKVLPTDTKLYSIIVEAVTPADAVKGITIKDLKGFEVDRIRLATVMEESDNKILKKLLEDQTVTIGNLGEKVDNIDLKDIFGSDCFTTDKTKAVTFANASMGRYKKVVDPNNPHCTMCVTGSCICEMYELIESDDDYYGEIYYISKDAQVWLFLFYDDSCGDDDGSSIADTDFNEDGFAYRYQPMHINLGNFEEKVAVMSEEIEHATVRQLVQVGFIPASDTYEKHTIGGYEVYTYRESLVQAIS